MKSTAKSSSFSLQLILIVSFISLAGCTSVTERGDDNRVPQADSIALAKALIKRGAMLMQADQSDSALIYYKHALSISESMAHDSLIAKSKNGIANYYLRNESYPEAVEYLTSALKSSEKARYDHCTGLIYNGLGLVSISMNEWDKAISYFEKAKRLCHEAGDSANEAGISLNIANCYAEINDFSKARDYYQENLDAMRRTGDTAQIVLAYINLGIVNRNLGNIQLSFRNLQEALRLLGEAPDQSLLSTTLLESGTTYFEGGDLRKARTDLNKALEIATGTLSKTNSMEALLRLSTLDEREGDMKAALDHFRRYTQLKDSVMNDETRRSIAEIRLNADVQKKEYENELLNRKYEIQKRKTANLWITFGSFFLLSLLTGVLIWLSQKNLRKSYKLQELENAHLQERIEAKNKELTTTSLQLVTKNKILSDISRMASEYYEGQAMNKTAFNGFQHIIRENLNTDRDWEQFKELFETVHRGFFTNLKSYCPDLTENELRLCAYLRINLQNKEISKMLNVHPDTVTTSRYRIRKKLHLDTKTVLEDFLRTL